MVFKEHLIDEPDGSLIGQQLLHNWQLRVRVVDIQLKHDVVFLLAMFFDGLKRVLRVVFFGRAWYVVVMIPALQRETIYGNIKSIHLHKPQQMVAIPRKFRRENALLLPKDTNRH